jgi:DNA-binding IclR family transcriptional regulator
LAFEGEPHRAQGELGNTEGYAVNDEEYNLEVRSVAVPVRDYTGGVVGGISACGPFFRMTDELLKAKIIPVVKDAGEKVSKRLGFGA